MEARDDSHAGGRRGGRTGLGWVCGAPGCASGAGGHLVHGAGVENLPTHGDGTPASLAAADQGGAERRIMSLIQTHTHSPRERARTHCSGPWLKFVRFVR